jgi:hypothetical protein
MPASANTSINLYGSARQVQALDLLRFATQGGIVYRPQRSHAGSDRLVPAHFIVRHRLKEIETIDRANHDLGGERMLFSIRPSGETLVVENLTVNTERDDHGHLFKQQADLQCRCLWFDVHDIVSARDDRRWGEHAAVA